MFAKYRKWKQTFLALGYIPKTMICDELKKNSVYMQGFDKRGTPIAVIFLERHIPCRKTIENLKRHFVYIFDKMFASSSRGQTRFTIIADFDGWTHKNVDIDGVFTVLQILQISRSAFIAIQVGIHYFIQGFLKAKFYSDKDLAHLVLEQMSVPSLCEGFAKKAVGSYNQVSPDSGSTNQRGTKS